jgi:uncharacterized hydrophobic protein (TIGR00271 family)
MQNPNEVHEKVHKTWRLFRNVGLKAIPILQVRESLLKESRPTLNYLVLIVSSCLIATFGLIVNSAAVIIGAMIIAPLMLPLRGFSFAMLEGDAKLLRNSFTSIAVGTLLGVTCSWLVGVIISLPDFGSEVLSRTQPTLIDLLIAVVAGGISGYAKIRPSIGDAIPGTAIAVALMPPICVIGLTLSQGLWQSSQGAFLLYITNLIGINLACLLVYVLSGYAQSNEMTRSLSWGVSITLIVLLAIPLGVSFWRLIQHAHIEDSVQEIVEVNRENIELTHSNIDWNTQPPTVSLVVRAAQPITPEQVAAIEASIQQEMGRPFKTIFDITPFQQVESATPQLQPN